MSVPTYKRQENKMEVILAGIKISKYIMLITSNEKIFKKEFKYLTERLCRRALDIPILLKKANRIRVDSKEKLEERITYQAQAYNACEALLDDMELGLEVYKFRINKLNHLGELVSRCQNLIGRWRKSDVSNFTKKQTRG